MHPVEDVIGSFRDAAGRLPKSNEHLLLECSLAPLGNFLWVSVCPSSLGFLGLFDMQQFSEEYSIRTQDASTIRTIVAECPLPPYQMPSGAGHRVLGGTSIHVSLPIDDERRDYAMGHIAVVYDNRIRLWASRLGKRLVALVSHSSFVNRGNWFVTGRDVGHPGDRRHDDPWANMAPDEDPLDFPIVDLCIPHAIRAVVARLGVKTIGQLVDLTEEDVLQGLVEADKGGDTTIEVIRSTLARKGLRLR